MLKLYTADINYNIIAPIDLYDGGITLLELKKEVNQSRELSMQFNTNLNEIYNFLLEPETKLVLELDNLKIGFTKNNGIVTHLCPYGETGAGSDLNTAILLNKTVRLKDNYNISDEFITDNNNTSYYIIDEKIKSIYQKKYYKIKSYSFSNENLTENNIDNQEQKLYNYATNYLSTKTKENSINQQIKRQNGVVDLTFYSSSFDLNNSKRILPVNQSYRGKISELCKFIDENFIFDILDDKEIILNTGTYNNFELLDEISKQDFISWREIGLFNDTNNKIKTKIQIGNFDNLPIKYLATNLIYDNIFEENIIGIESIKYSYPTLTANFDIKFNILEGENIKVEYKEYIENIDNTITEIFNINKVQSYKSSTINLLSLL